LRKGVAASDSKGWVKVAAGVVLAVGVIGATAGVVAGLVALADAAGVWTALAVRALLIDWGLAVRSLRDETLRASEAPELERARAELAMVVGRDTGGLDRAGVCRACVETVAENCNDAVVAPLFWYAVGGVVGLWAFKAVNTLDSLVGYRDERYRRLGWASARLDDLAGLLPARLTWLLISAGSLLVGERPAGALRVGWRDGRKHSSPNAAWGEAAMAGALGVQLGGEATYRGVPYEKPRLGDPGAPIDPATVRRAARVMTAAALLAAGLAWLARAWLWGRA
jgi:adenosylcobinamide-phosphate synthase